MDYDFVCTQALPSEILDSASSDEEGNTKCVGILKVLPSNDNKIPAVEFSICSGQSTIGRHSSCDISIPWSVAVSKKHAILEAECSTCFVTDLNSSNRTRLAGVKLKPNVKYGLRDTDELMFGDVKCVFYQKVDEDEKKAGLDTPKCSKSMLAADTPECSMKNSNVCLSINESGMIIPESQPTPKDEDREDFGKDRDTSKSSIPAFQLDETFDEDNAATLDETGAGMNISHVSGSGADADFHMDSDTDVEDAMDMDIYNADTMDLASTATSQSTEAESTNIRNNSDDEDEDYEESLITNLTTAETQRLVLNVDDVETSVVPKDFADCDDKEASVKEEKLKQMPSFDVSGCSGITSHNPPSDLNDSFDEDDFGELCTQAFVMPKKMHVCEDTLGLLETQAIVAPSSNAEDEESNPDDSLLYDMPTQAFTSQTSTPQESSPSAVKVTSINLEDMPELGESFEQETDDIIRVKDPQPAISPHATEVENSVISTNTKVEDATKVAERLSNIAGNEADGAKPSTIADAGRKGEAGVENGSIVATEDSEPPQSSSVICNLTPSVEKNSGFSANTSTEVQFAEADSSSDDTQPLVADVPLGGDDVSPTLDHTPILRKTSDVVDNSHIDEQLDSVDDQNLTVCDENNSDEEATQAYSMDLPLEEENKTLQSSNITGDAIARESIQDISPSKSLADSSGEAAKCCSDLPDAQSSRGENLVSSSQNPENASNACQGNEITPSDEQHNQLVENTKEVEQDPVIVVKNLPQDENREGKITSEINLVDSSGISENSSIERLPNSSTINSGDRNEKQNLPDVAELDKNPSTSTDVQKSSKPVIFSENDEATQQYGVLGVSSSAEEIIDKNEQSEEGSKEISNEIEKSDEDRHPDGDTEAPVHVKNDDPLVSQISSGNSFDNIKIKDPTACEVNDTENQKYDIVRIPTESVTSDCRTENEHLHQTENLAAENPDVSESQQGDDDGATQCYLKTITTPTVVHNEHQKNTRNAPACKNDKTSMMTITNTDGNVKAMHLEEDDALLMTQAYVVMEPAKVKPGNQPVTSNPSTDNQPGSGLPQMQVLREENLPVTDDHVEKVTGKETDPEPLPSKTKTEDASNKQSDVSGSCDGEVLRKNNSKRSSATVSKDENENIKFELPVRSSRRSSRKDYASIAKGCQSPTSPAISVKNIADSSNSNKKTTRTSGRKKAQVVENETRGSGPKNVVNAPSRSIDSDGGDGKNDENSQLHSIFDEPETNLRRSSRRNTQKQAVTKEKENSTTKRKATRSSVHKDTKKTKESSTEEWTEQGTQQSKTKSTKSNEKVGSTSTDAQVDDSNSSAAKYSTGRSSRRSNLTRKDEVQDDNQGKSSVKTRNKRNPVDSAPLSSDPEIPVQDQNEDSNNLTKKETRRSTRRKNASPNIPNAAADGNVPEATAPQTRKRRNVSAGSSSATKKKSKSDDSGSDSQQQQVSKTRPRQVATKPKVMFTGISDNTAESIVSNLGGHLATDISDCTHLVTDKMRRTIKFLSAVARGLLIVTPQWVYQSNDCKRFLSEDDFLLCDDKQPGGESLQGKYNFNLEETLKRVREAKNPLFHNLQVFVTKNVCPNSQQMGQILNSGGATVLSKMPSFKNGQHCENTVIVATPGDKNTVSNAVKCGCKIVSNEFVLTGVLRNQIDFNSFSLFDSCPETSAQNQASGDQSASSRKKRPRRK